MTISIDRPIRVYIALFDSLEVHVGVRQGCLQPPTLFNTYQEFVMKELGELDQTLTLSDTFSIDIMYADDITLLSAIFEKLKESTKQLDAGCKKWGMKKKCAKCKIISPSKQAVVQDGSEVEHVKEFVFRGSIVPNSTDNVRIRISLAQAAFWQKKTRYKQVSKMRLYKALILPIATYAAVT